VNVFLKDIRHDFRCKRLVIDGGLGTELEDRIDRNDRIHPKNSHLWSGKVLMERPEYIQAIHEDYINAGADIIITSTYQLSHQNLRKYEDFTTEQITQLWQRSIDTAHTAIKSCNVNRPIYVVGSIGPYGGFLGNGAEYSGNYGQVNGKQLNEFFLPLTKYFHSSKKIDIIGFETMASFQELKSIMNMMKHFPHKPFYISCNVSENGLPDGTSLQTLVSYLTTKLATSNVNFLALGINCTDYLKITSIISILPQSLPLMIYPNLGFVFDPTTNGYIVHRDDAKWTKCVNAWLQHDNVRAIGGCCSTTPHTIALVTHEVKKDAN
jgi:homocysteine S-methyltransferase